MKILSLLVSNKVSVNDDTKNITIEGVFNSIGAFTFPAKHKELTVSLITQGIAGKHYFKISIMKGNKELAAVDKEALTGISHRFIANFYDVVFPEPGTYTIKAIADKEKLTTDINLNLLKQTSKL